MQIQWLATALKIKQHLLEKRETLASLKVSHFLPEEWPLTEEKSSISHPLLDINPQKSNFRLLWWPKVREQNFDTSEISLSLKDLKLFRGPLGITGTFFEFLSVKARASNLSSWLRWQLFKLMEKKNTVWKERPQAQGVLLQKKYLWLLITQTRVLTTTLQKTSHLFKILINLI